MSSGGNPLLSFRGAGALALPDPKSERWKYSNLRAALLMQHPEVQGPDWETSGAFDFLESVDPTQKRISGTGELWDLNNRYAPKVVRLFVPRHREAARPVFLSLRGAGRHVIPWRIDIEGRDGSDITIIETHTGEDSYWKNGAITIRLAREAKLTHYRILEDDPFSVSTHAVHVELEQGAKYKMVSLMTGGGFTRQEFDVSLLGQDASVDLSGLTLLRGKQLGDTTIRVDHVAPHCRSNQFFKTVLEGMSHGVYQGKVHVGKEAQKTDGYQLSNHLILSPLAEMSVKPELEIYADDVKCSHGTTTGPLDETPMFYLRSRGLSEEAARRMLMESFLGEVLDKITTREAREKMQERISAWLT